MLALPLALTVSACSEAPTAPERPANPGGVLLQREVPSGSVGLVLDNLTRVSIPIAGQLQEVTVEQAVIDEIILGNVVGGIIGLEVTGRISGTVDALGTELVNEQFTSTLGVTPGPGGCKIVTLDLGIKQDVLGLLTVEADPVAVEGNGSGAVGSLLCAVGTVLSGVTGGATRAVEGLLGAINRLI